ncbi:enoyl-CoA hydratase/isomerase family protein [Ancylobacter dichloromethanicus]|uniref:Enoyl-CoA hydratase n=1 Tax=Ancylobacter dichloromethanicus TaxID=518825 RepID=A0A9W6MZZ2_9HYPH|nr:enoyl-CoA hydratase [Ancylobacter dichloromethanicus]MBS7553568.1 enoyl-CoA hydratase/isomerase family protein [Ancylobacter dichloromethanicus]GLK72628.1 enoyl-CoA hydratase [Ancylobacter dichloromethanicus]
MNIAAPTETKAAPDQGRVHFSRDGAVARLVFDRPSARNAMTWAMYEQLAQACAAIAADPAIRVAVLRGAGGRAFIAGTDIEQFRAFTSGQDGIAYEEKVDHYVSLLEQVPVPTVAVVEGWAAGGGMALANACDFRLATPGARFGVPIARTLGNCLSASNLQRLVATLGVGMVRRMLLAAEMPTAEEMPAGYVAIHAPEAIDTALDELCGRLAGNAPLTLRVTKQMLARLAHDPHAPDADLVRAIYGSADFHEGVESFLAKRPAQWRGE